MIAAYIDDSFYRVDNGAVPFSEFLTGYRSSLPHGQASAATKIAVKAELAELGFQFYEVGYQKKLMVAGLSLTPPPPPKPEPPPPKPEPTVEEQIARLEAKLEECLRHNNGWSFSSGIAHNRAESLRRRIRELRGEPEPIKPVKPERYVHKHDENGNRALIDRMPRMTLAQYADYDKATTQSEVDRILDECGFRS